MDHGQHRTPEPADGTIFRAKWALLAFIAVAAYFLITEHRAHLSGYLTYLPFLLLLACPLLHVFMHGGHGDDRSGSRHEQGSEPGEKR